MKILLALSLFLLSTTSGLAAQSPGTSPGTGLGVTLGSPNGVIGRSWFTEENSIDYGFGWSVMDSSQFQLYSDYLWTRPDIFELNEAKFDLFFGGGLGLRSHSGKNGTDMVLGPRLPIGVSHEFSQPDLEVFAQFALNLGIIPSADLYVDLNVGVRFYLF